MADWSPYWERWPEGLRETNFLFTLDVKQVRFADLSAKFTGLRAIQVREGRLSGTLRGPTSEAKVHGHFRVRTREDKVRFDLSIAYGQVNIGANSLQVDEFVSMLAESLDTEASQITVTAISSLLFSTDEWRSNVALPVTIPGMLDSATGSPEIAGFEFAFREDSSPLRRASVALFSDTEEYYVQLAHVLELESLQSLIERGVSAAGEFAKVLVARANSTSPEEQHA
jgi:hypothetical protein